VFLWLKGCSFWRIICRSVLIPITYFSFCPPLASFFRERDVICFAISVVLVRAFVKLNRFISLCVKFVHVWCNLFVSPYIAHNIYIGLTCAPVMHTVSSSSDSARLSLMSYRLQKCRSAMTRTPVHDRRNSEILVSKVAFWISQSSRDVKVCHVSVTTLCMHGW